MILRGIPARAPVTGFVDFHAAFADVALDLFQRQPHRIAELGVARVMDSAQVHHHQLQEAIAQRPAIGRRQRSSPRESGCQKALSRALFVPRVIGVVWPAKDIATLAHVVLATLFGRRLGVMVALAQRGESIEGWKRIAAFCDRGAMIDHGRRFNFANLETCLAQWVLSQLLQARCHLCVEYGQTDISLPHPIKAATSIAGCGCAAIASAISKLTTPSMWPIARFLLGFRLAAESISIATFDICQRKIG